MDIGMPELLIVLVVVVLVFGVGRLGKMGGELGTAIRQFRDSVKGEEQPVPATPPAPAAPQSPDANFQWDGFNETAPNQDKKG